MDLGYDVMAFDLDALPCPRAQRGVQRRPVFRRIDTRSLEQGIDARTEFTGPREFQKKTNGLRIRALFRVIEIPARRLDVHPLGAIRIVPEEIAQVPLRIAQCVTLQCLPL